MDTAEILKKIRTLEIRTRGLVETAFAFRMSALHKKPVGAESASPTEAANTDPAHEEVTHRPGVTQAHHGSLRPIDKSLLAIQTKPVSAG